MIAGIELQAWSYLAIIRLFRSILQNIDQKSSMLARIVPLAWQSGYHSSFSLHITEHRSEILDASQDRAAGMAIWISFVFFAPYYRTSIRNPRC